MSITFGSDYRDKATLIGGVIFGLVFGVQLRLHNVLHVPGLLWHLGQSVLYPLRVVCC